ncbi:MAG: ATP-binding cassette domain-containing protein [Cyanophyceae cyanobacterium]
MSKRRLLWGFARKYPVLMFFSVAFGFTGALFAGIGTTLLVPVILRVVGQDALLKDGPPLLQALFSPFNSLPEQYQSIAMAGAVIVAIALKNLTAFLGLYTSNKLQRGLASDLRMSGCQMLLDVDLSYHAKTRAGDITNRLGAESNRVASTISNIIKLLMKLLSITVFAVLLITISWQLTIIVTALLSTVVILNQWFVKRARILGQQLSIASRDYSRGLLDMLLGMALVRTSAMEAVEFKKLKSLIKNLENRQLMSQLNGSAVGPVTELASITCLMSIVIISRFVFEDIEALSAVLLTYLVILFRLLPLLSELNSLRSNISNTLPSVEIIEDFLSRTNKPFMKAGNIGFPAQLEQGIHFDNIRFAYEGADDLTLKGIELYLPKGTTLALVGGSGAGKSTLADLLPRFADPSGGKITVDGVDLRDFALGTVRRAMGIVSQDTFLFNTSVRDNITYGTPGSTEEELYDAARRANALEFIEQLPRGFDTPIGDRGVMLSGGQRQRLAIARALISKPTILILDEATSALDTVSERLVQEAIENLSRDRTSLVIAHRLSTVQNADQIAVMEKGKVVEVGTHGQLLAKNGHYAKLYRMQFAAESQQLVTANETFNRTSYELRSRLNVTIGALQLLVEDWLDSPEEAQELIEQSYKSSIRMLSTMELFEDSLQMQKSLYRKGGKSSNVVTPKLAARYETFTKTSYDVRGRLNAMIGGLRFVMDDLADSGDERMLMLKQTYDAALYIFDTFERLESAGNKVQ